MDNNSERTPGTAQPITSGTGRVFHITWYKCGSQWVRAVLTDPEVLTAVGFRSGQWGNWLESGLTTPEGDAVVFAPVYEMNAIEWKALKRWEDKAIVVVRDPRDCLVSYLYSLLYSHARRPGVDLRRDILYQLGDLESRLRFLLGEVYFQQHFYRSWFEYSGGDALLVKYEDIIDDPNQCFATMLDWLGWDVSVDTVASVVERHSFESRSGRTLGDVDVVSHFRRGVPGDWRNHFSRRLGELWERLYPGLLSSTGYETTGNWWMELPETLSDRVDGLLPGDAERIDAQQKRIAILEKELVEKEMVIQELKAACDARLKLVRELSGG